jgi:hypothetical protein
MMPFALGAVGKAAGVVGEGSQYRLHEGNSLEFFRRTSLSGVAREGRRGSGKEATPGFQAEGITEINVDCLRGRLAAPFRKQPVRG